jgi:hypothetical protein
MLTTVTNTSGVIWDEADAPIVQHFTPRNSWGFEGNPTYSHLPHAWRIRFMNEDMGYAQDERIVYDDGYNADGSGGLMAATLFDSIEFPGITDPDLIWKFGRFHIAQVRLRPAKYSLTVGWENLEATRGSRVRVSHDVPLWGAGWGRVISSGVVGANDTIELDEPVTMEAGTDYTIRFRLENGTSLVRDVVTDDGVHTSLVLDGHGTLPGDDDMWMFGERGLESVVLRVLRIDPGPDFTARLTLVDDAPEISLADQGAIPAFDSKITLPFDLFTAAPVDLTVQEAFAGIDGATTTGALLSWSTIAGDVAVAFEVEYRDDDGDNAWKSTDTVIAPDKAKFLPGLLQGTWSFRVRSVFADGSFSRWTELALTTITAGGELILPDVTNFVTSYDDSTAGLKWDKVKFSKLEVFYEIRRGDAWDIALTLEANIADPPVALTGNGTYWIKAKAQPLPGITIYSQNAVSLAISGAILVRNVLASLDERGNGWTGTYEVE